MKKNQLKNLKFGRLLVVDYDHSKNGNAYWKCTCDCGNTTITSGNRLKRGETMSCGCLKKEKTSAVKKKYNEYRFDANVAEGITTNTGKKFVVDIDDYEKIKNYCWIENGQGYIIARDPISKKCIRMHRFILDFPTKHIIDHINGNKADNRKDNLRLANKSQNGINRGYNVNNRLKIKGVSLINGKYIARIMVDYKNIHLGSFDTIEKAIEARKIAEIKYFGEFAYGK